MLIERFSENPIIKPSDIKPSSDDFEVIGAFNAGVTEYQGKTLLLLRVAEWPKDRPANEQIAPILNPATGMIDYVKVANSDPELDATDPRIFIWKDQAYLTSISHLRIATSADGINFDITDTPSIQPRTSYETFGLEDPRITKIGDKYYITCKVVSEIGIATSLISTTDFIDFKRLGIIFCPENLDVVIFPEKIDGKYFALTRPVTKNIGPLAIWIASSNDLINWGDHRALITPRAGEFDSARVGASCVPIKTPEGWLEIYHGADHQHRYCLAAALLDLEDPTKVLAYSKEPIMYPQADYELNGFFGNVVFSCGAITKPDGQIIIYYGASDECTAAAKTSINDILSEMKYV